MNWNAVRALGAAAVLLTTGAAVAVLPIRPPEVYEVVEKVVPATEAEKKAGVLVTLFLKDRKDGVPVTKDTPIHRQMGKLVPVVEVGAIEKGQKLSVWVDPKTGTAEGVLIFP